MEAYKRLALHWRSRNNWKRPGIAELLSMLTKVYGIDLEAGAIELAAFSLCLALCDALEPEEIRTSINSFPPLAGKTLHHACFFEAKEHRLVEDASVSWSAIHHSSPPWPRRGQREATRNTRKNFGSLPDKQLLTSFCMRRWAWSPKAVCSVCFSNTTSYNQQSLGFRRGFLAMGCT